MELQDLKKQSNIKVLLEGESGNGKTYQACRVALSVLASGGRVKYVDTEAEGSTTMVTLVETGDWDNDVVEELEYVQVSNLSQLKENIQDAGEFDLLIIDTLDHKHSFVLKSVTNAKRDSGADWQEYASIYAEEKEVMEIIGKPDTNVIATLDPESGSRNKPKGAQTNIRGYFTIVLRMLKSDDDWTHKIVNWVGHGDKAGHAHPDLVQKLTAEIMARKEVKA